MIKLWNYHIFYYDKRDRSTPSRLLPNGHKKWRRHSPYTENHRLQQSFFLDNILMFKN